MVKVAESQAGASLPSLLVDVAHFAMHEKCEPLHSKRSWIKIEKFLLTGKIGAELVGGLLDLASVRPNYRSAIALKGQNSTQLPVDLIHTTPYLLLPSFLDQLHAAEKKLKFQEIKEIIEGTPKFSNLDLRGQSLEGLFEMLIITDQQIARIESGDLAVIREDTKSAVKLFKLHRNTWKERADILFKLDQIWERIDPKGFAAAVNLQIEHAYLDFNNSRGYLRPSFQNRLAEFVTTATKCPIYLIPKKDGSTNLKKLSQLLIHDRNADWRADWRYSPTGYRQSQYSYKALFPERHLSPKGMDHCTFDRKQRTIAARSKIARLELIGE